MESSIPFQTERPWKLADEVCVEVVELHRHPNLPRLLPALPLLDPPLDPPPPLDVEPTVDSIDVSPGKAAKRKVLVCMANICTSPFS